MKSRYRILHLEDVQTDAELVSREMKKNNIDFEHCVIDTLPEYINALENFNPDIILCDHSLPAFNSIKALEVLHEKNLKIPFILITATMSEDVAMSVLNKGADDYILKDRLKRLPFAVVNAIEKATYEKDRKQMIVLAYEKELKIKNELEALSEKLLMATEVAGLGIWEYNIADNSLTVDDTILRLNGVSRENFDGSFQYFTKLVHPEDTVWFNKQVEEGMHKENYTITFRVLRPDGSVRWLKSAIRNQRAGNGAIERIIGTSQDVTEEKLRELAIKESEEKYRSFYESSMDGIIISIPNKSVVSANASAQAIFKATEAELRKRKRKDIFDFTDPRTHHFIEERAKKGQAKGEVRMLRHDGTTFEAEVSSTIFSDAFGKKRSSLIIRDISERITAQKMILLSSNALKTALEDVRKILSSSLDIICTADETGRFVLVSNACTNIWQYTPTELAGRLFLDFVHPDDVQKTIEMATAIKTGTPVTMFENRYIRKDGTEVPMIWSARWDEQSQLTYCVAKDATDKMRFEKAFEYERQRFKEMFHRAPSCIGASKGKDHRYELANDSYLQLIGKTDIIGKTIKEVLPEIEAQGLIKILDTVFETGNMYSASEKLVQLDLTGNGELSDLFLNFIYQPYRDKNGDVEGIFVFANNVTEQVLARRKVITESANLQAILNNSDVSYILLDTDCKIMAFNRKANENMLATYDRTLQNGLYYLNGFSKEIRARSKENIERVFAGESIDSEVYFPTIDGEPRWYHYKMNPISIENNVGGVCIAAEDITIKKEAEIEREKITQDLIQRNVDLEQFNYIVSHNLRAPVANISGAVSILNSNDLHPDNIKLFWNAVSISIERLDTVIKDLNTILEIKNKQNKGKEIVSFSKLTQNIKESITSPVEDADFEIITDFSEVESMETVKSYLYSVFYNLISNSLKYRQPNISPVVTITSHKIDQKVQLIFSDNGLGFDADKKKEHIFKLYKRFHNHIEGKGMGLFIAKTQIETLGGKIDVASTVNNGTTFTITI